MIFYLPYPHTHICVITFHEVFVVDSLTTIINLDRVHEEVAVILINMVKNVMKNFVFTLQKCVHLVEGYLTYYSKDHNRKQL